MIQNRYASDALSHQISKCESVALDVALDTQFDPRHPVPTSLADAEGAFEWIQSLLEIAGVYLAQYSGSNDSDTFVVAHTLSVTLQQRYGHVLAAQVRLFLRRCLDIWMDGGDEDAVHHALLSYCKLHFDLAYEYHLVELLEARITVHIEGVIGGEYDRVFMPELQEWFTNTIVPFLNAFLSTSQRSVGAREQVDRLRSYLAESYVKVRSAELFDVIAGFPDTMVAIRELRDVANSTNYINVVGKIFGAALQRRLLHLGASTKQILDMYISVIRALRILDPSDTLLNYVTKPVRKYLRDRKDTVRTIVSSLTQSRGEGGEGGGASELHGELRRGGGSLSLGLGASDDEDEAINTCEQWKPAKRHPDIAFTSGRGYDILALLVSIYGSTDLFVQEYRNLLSEKLIQLINYDADIEISTLELLKIR